MAKQSSVNLDITNNADGFDISGGTTPRRLGITGGDVTIAGSGSATVTFPTTSTTIAGLGIAQSFTALQTFSAGISASGATFTGLISGATATFSKDITVNSMTVGFGGGDFDSNVVLGGQNALLDNTIGTYNIAIGGGALASNTEGNYNTAIGGSALGANIVGTDNIAIGNQTLFSKATGSNNIAIGGFALWHAAESENNIAIGTSVMQGSLGFGYNPGSYNIGIGADVLKSQTFTGNSNVAIGYAAGTDATTASQMTALGYQAGRYLGTGTTALTTGTGGIYIGYQARAGANARTNEIVIGVDARGLGSNTAVIGATLQSAATIYGVLNLPSGLSASGATFTGSISGATATFSKDITVNSMTVGLGGGNSNTNVAVGYRTLIANTNGTSNLAIGYNALGSNTDGEENVAIGYGTLQNTFSGFGNIAIGSLALGGYSVGSYNIAIGRSALGAAGNTGTFNTGIGFQSLQANTTGTNNTGIGYQSLYLDTTGLDNTGIGTNTLKALTTGSYNTGVGSSAFRSLTTASQMTALGNNAGRYRGTGTDTNTTGTGGIYIGYQARGSTLAQTNEIVIGADALGLGSNTAVIGATLQSAATIYGVLNLPSGLSASGATFTGNISARNIVTSFNGLTGAVTGITAGGINTFTQLNTFSAGISASGATFSAPITSTRMARHTSAAISAVQTAAFSPTVAQDGTVFYIDYGGKGMDITLEGLPIGWRAKFLNINSGNVNFTAPGDIYGYGAINGLGQFMQEAICIATNTYFIG